MRPRLGRALCVLLFCVAVAAPLVMADSPAAPGADRLIPLTSLETSPQDLDGDGLPQKLEHDLAAAFLPRIFYDPPEPCSLPGALAWREPGRIVYFVTRRPAPPPPRPDEPPRPEAIEIIYALLYHEDCGFNSHAGDAEPIVVRLHRNPACQLGWGLHSFSAQAHGSATGFMWGDGECHIQSGAASVLVSKGKHGMFLSVGKCNAHILDHCSYGRTISAGRDEWIALNAGETDARLHVRTLYFLHNAWGTEGLWMNQQFCGGRPCTNTPGLPGSPPPIETKIHLTVAGPLMRAPNSAGDLIQPLGSLNTPHGTAIWQPVVGADRYKVSLFRSRLVEGPDPYYEWVYDRFYEVSEPRWTVPADLGCEGQCGEHRYGYFKIEARAANGSGSAPVPTIDTFSLFPACQTPPESPPTPLGPSGPTAGDPVLRWQPPLCATGFDVEVYVQGTPEPVFTAQAHHPEARPPILECDVEHWWQVRGTNVHGPGPWSSQMSFTPSCIPLPPNAPTDLVALAVPGQHTLVDLTWTDRSDNERGFVVRRLKVGTTAWEPIADLEPDVTSFRDDVPEIGSYFYKVWAYNTGGDNISDRAGVTLYHDPPNPPDTLRPRGCIEDPMPTLTWRDGGQSSQFYVRLINARTGQEAMPDVTTTGTSVAVPYPLEPGGSYMLRVWGINNVGWGPGSGPEYLVLSCADLPAPSIEVPAPGCADPAPTEVRWTPVEGAIGYRARMSRVTVSGDVPIWDYDGPETRGQIPAGLLTAGEEYRVKVKASTGVDGPYSPLRFFVVGCDALGRPGTPSPVAPVGGTVATTLPTYIWEPAAQATAYTLEVWVNMTSPPLFSQSWPASEVCDETLCSARAAHPLPAGTYHWRVRGANPALPTPNGIGGPWATISVPSLTPTLSVTNISVAENRGPARFRVRLENPPVSPVEVSYATAADTATPGSDYDPVLGRLRFAPGQEEAVVEVPILDDPLYEGGAETFFLHLSDASSGAVLARDFAMGVIDDDEPIPAVSVANLTVPENQTGTPVRLQFSLSGPSATAIAVPLGAGSCTATAGSDFVAPKEDAVEFAPGATQASIEVAVLDDAHFEGHEVARFDLGIPAGAVLQQPWAELRIRDDDPPLGRLSRPRADFDRDGGEDLVWRRDGSGQLSVWTMDGNERRSGFLIQSAGSPDPGWEVVATADFDGDGDGDVVWRNRTSGKVVLWSVEAGTVVAGTVLPGMADPAWRVVGSGDLDRDGQPDLLLWHEAQGTVKAWLMQGWVLREERTLTPATAADQAWQPAALADLDGDGAADLVWRHKTSGRLSVWFLDGTVRRTGGLLAPETTPSLDWKLVGGWDVDSDGRADLVFQEDRSKRLMVWYVSGGQLRCAAGFTPPAPADTNWSLVGPR